MKKTPAQFTSINILNYLDFTTHTFAKLIGTLKSLDYDFIKYQEAVLNPTGKFIVLRHDVEAKYENALILSKIENEINIHGTYYFRILPNHFKEDIIVEISSLGHEIGYHYDDYSYCKGNYQAAIHRFEKNLDTLRKIAEVKTICMEGAPLSKYDNRDLWKKYNYRDYGIIGEPYFDTDFSKVFYLTDTGRRWDGKGSVRDKVGSQQSAVGSNLSPFGSPSPNWRGGEGVRLKSTNDIIAAANAGLLPDQIMFTFHPQRWNDKPLPWLQELVMQNLKNLAKRVVLRFKG